MISNLLSGLDGSAPSGLHALLNPKAAGSSSSFARLLQQQSDLVDTDLEQWLLSLNIEPEPLFAELHAAGLNAKALLTELKHTPALNKELTIALKDRGVPTRLIDALGGKHKPLLSDQQEKSKKTLIESDAEHSSSTALSFIQSTLFIAQEASSLRRDLPARYLAENQGHFNSRFQVSSESGSDHLTTSSRQVAASTEGLVQSAIGLTSTHPASHQTAITTPVSTKVTQNQPTQNQPTQNQPTQNTPDLRFELSSTHTSQNTAAFTMQTSFGQQENSESLRQNINASHTLLPLGQTDSTNVVTFAPAQLVSSPLQPMVALPPNYSAHLSTPVTHTQWGSDLGRVVVNLGQQAQLSGPQNAEIRLDPPELGPLRIMLSVTDNIAHATIYAAHAQTRLVVEQALPQLQQQLAQSGLSLGETNVSDQGFTNHSEQDSSQQQASATFSLEGSVQTDELSALPGLDEGTKRLVPDAIIDTFA